MATEIKYNGSVISSPEAGQTATLKCAGMRMESDVVVEVGEMPEASEPLETELAEQEALIAELKEVLERKGTGDNEEWFNDGNTHLWIHLSEGRTSPMVGVCPNGTVTVDWGDGTTPDVLTGTSTSEVKFTPNHNYASAGDYVITLTVDGEIGFVVMADFGVSILSYSSSYDDRNRVYQNALRKIEIGNGVTSIGDYSFAECYALSSANIGNNVTSIGESAFYNCTTLSSVSIGNGVTTIAVSAFYGCNSLSSILIPNSVTSIGGFAFSGCYALSSVGIGNGVTSIGESAFNECYALSSVSIGNNVTSIGGFAFSLCSGMAFYDFTNHTVVPTLGASVFGEIPEDCEIRVPAALVDEWKAAPNWSEYADHIVGV